MRTAADRAKERAAAAQRPAADPAASVWVAASAGTGKTKVLTDRVLSLMLHGSTPARILCLTFTKAAAAEMAIRLAQRLARWATLSQVELSAEIEDLLGRRPGEARIGRARQLFAQVLDAPGGMKIQTIHAFCQSLLGRFPLEAGVAPHFRVLDERSATEMLRQARGEILDAAGGADDDPSDPALAAAMETISIYAQEDEFTKLMGALARERGRLARLIRRHGGADGLEAAVYRALDVEPGATARDMVRAACEDEALDQMGLRLVGEALAAGTKAEGILAVRLSGWLAGGAAERFAGFADYTTLYLTQKGVPRVNLLTKAARAAVPGALDIMRSEAERLLALRTGLNALTVARATAALLRVGAAILDTYRRHKQDRALLDYDDLILRARDLLQGQGAASWVLFKLDGGLDHILIDEAQDTNPEQWEIVDMLSAEFFAGAGARKAPRTVFAVGDAKQSIFSFQRADPAAFARMRAHFAERARAAAQAWATVDLAHSFRSTGAVLRAVDAVFAQEPARAGVLSGETALSHRAVRIGQAGLVELWPPAEAGDAPEAAPWAPPTERHWQAPARARLARLVAQRIFHWTTATGAGPGEAAWLDSKRRRVEPGDILVLVRRRNEFVEELVRELKRLGVPVAGVDRMILREQIAVMDLIALGRVALLPEDDLTLAAVLKGPFFGLDEDQLFRLAWNREGTLWQALTARARTDPAYRAARVQVAELLARADFAPPYEFFAEALTRDWGRGRGRELLLARLGPEAEDPIEEFLSLALAYEREHAPSLEGFLHWVEVGAQEVRRNMELGRDAVRVMTVHGAKGLQAPIVILPDTLQTPPSKAGLLWPKEAEGLAFWTPHQDYDGEVTGAARDGVRAADGAEYRRLLYVALTRAEDRLYVCGWTTTRGPPPDCWYRFVERAMEGMGEAVAFDFDAEIEDGWAGQGWRLSCPQTAEAPESERPKPSPDRTAAAPPDWVWQAPPPEPAPPRPLAPSRPAGEEPATLSPLGPDRGRRFHRGNLIHRLLQSLPDLPPERRREAAARFLASPVHALSEVEQAEISAAALAVLKDPGFATLFGPGSRAEVPLAGVVELAHGVEVVSGQVDRLVVTDQEILIVDYKSNRPAPETEARIPAQYLRQMAAYRAVLAGVYPDRPIRCALLWTEGPRLMRLSDAALAVTPPLHPRTI